MAQATQGDEAEQKVWQLIETIGTGMMTTLDEGVLRARPMHGQVEPEQGRIWFFTRADAAKAEEIGASQQVNVAYADPSHERYVSISGPAALVRDRAKIEALWNPFVEAWFPNGKSDPNVALIELMPEQAEYWDSPASKVVQLWQLAKARATSSTPDLGQNEKVDL